MNAAYIVTEAMEHHRDNKQQLLLATLDAQKAFDRVNHEILFNKLYHIGITGPLWLLLRNLYRQATVKIKWEGELSPDFELKQGTKQGAQLSTTLYKIYHNHLLNCISESGIGACIGNINISSPTCADDTAILANTEEELQQMLNLVEFTTKRELVKINPDKSEILVLKPKQHVDVTFDGNRVAVVSEIKHLGINRNCKNMVEVDTRLQTAQKTIYALLGPGLHAKRGMSPIISYNIWKTFVIPRFLYGIEVQSLLKSHLGKLEKYQRKILKYLQGLPERTSTAAVHIMLGAEPIEMIIDRNCMSLFLNIARLPGSTEHKILTRQLAMQDRNTFTANIRSILQKYNLPSPESILHDVPTKQVWKQLFQKATNSYWYTIWSEELANKSSTKYMQIQPNPVSQAHNVWKAADPKSHEIRRAEIKSRLLSGTYTLQSNTAKFNQNSVPPTCNLCMEEDETRQHLLVRCSSLKDVKQNYLCKLEAIIDDNTLYTSISSEDALLTQLTLDCTHSAVRARIQLNDSQIYHIERWSQAYCEALVNTRTKILSSK